MIFNFSNVGCIEEASIELKGLTIITGLNDSGKSYLTKSIFSIIKTLNQVGSEDKRKQIETAQNFINQVFSLCSQIVFITPEINSKINPSVVIPEIISNIEANTSLRGVNKIISNYQENVIKIINSISTSDEQAKKNVLQSIDDEYNYARPILSSKNNNQDKLSSFFSDTIIKGFFHDQLSNLNRPNLKIELREGQNILLEIEVRNKTVRKFKQHFPIIYKDATLIETPIILQLARYFNLTLAFGFTSFTQNSKSELPYHFYDLAEKMFKSSSQPKSLIKFPVLYQEIAKIIEGEVLLNREDYNFYFHKNGIDPIKSSNIASGIKSFGLLQLLLTGGYINHQSILIIDEPEVHLHPEWEVKYAKIIVELSKAGIPIIVSSHSPYFLKAVKAYTMKYRTNEITKFYFGEIIDDKKTGKFIDVTSDLEPVFKKLAEPMMEISLI